MNQDLIKFIELCLSDGVISDKEREVIFRKAKEYGVPEDECEIILEGMISKSNKVIGQKSSAKNNIGKQADRTFIPKIIQHIQPAILNREGVFSEEIKGLIETNQIISEKVEELIKNQTIQFTKLNEIIEFDLKNLENKKAALIDNYGNAFLAEINPILEKKLAIKFKSGNFELYDNLIKKDSSILKTNPSFWENHRPMKNRITYFFTISFLIVYVFLVTSLTSTEEIRIMFILFPIGIMLMLYNYLVKIKIVFKDTKMEQVIKELQKDDFLDKIIREVNNKFKHSLVEINSLDKSIFDLRESSEQISTILKNELEE